jgi:hypothetical protein
MICFRQSRTKLAALTALFAAWALVFGFFAVITALQGGLWPYVGLSFFTPLALACIVGAVSTALHLANPATLTADDHCVVFRTHRSERRIAWSEIADFIIFSPTSRLRSPGCELKEGARKFVSFGRNWEKTAEEIVEALEEARKKSEIEHQNTSL